MHGDKSCIIPEILRGLTAPKNGVRVKQTAEDNDILWLSNNTYLIFGFGQYAMLLTSILKSSFQFQRIGNQHAMLNQTLRTLPAL